MTLAYAQPILVETASHQIRSGLWHWLKERQIFVVLLGVGLLNLAIIGLLGSKAMSVETESARR